MNSYGYDADGNRDTQSLNGANTTFTLGGSSNRLISASGGLNANYSYDADGDLTSDGTHTYSYDDTDRLTSITTSSGTDTYEYNALGQRVEKTVGGTTTVFVYDWVVMGLTFSPAVHPETRWPDACGE